MPGDDGFPKARRTAGSFTLAMTSRTRILPTLLLALVAAAQTTCAVAGYQRVGVACLVGEHADLVSFADTADKSVSPSFGAAVGPVRHDERRGPTVQDREDFVLAVTSDSSACGSPVTSSSSGHGASATALPSAVSVSSPAPLTGLLPTEMGPSFANPPPWTPLRPPRMS